MLTMCNPLSIGVAPPHMLLKLFNNRCQCGVLNRLRWTYPPPPAGTFSPPCLRGLCRNSAAAERAQGLRPGLRAGRGTSQRSPPSLGRRCHLTGEVPTQCCQGSEWPHWQARGGAAHVVRWGRRRVCCAHPHPWLPRGLALHHQSVQLFLFGEVQWQIFKECKRVRPGVS